MFQLSNPFLIIHPKETNTASQGGPCMATFCGTAHNCRGTGSTWALSADDRTRKMWCVCPIGKEQDPVIHTKLNLVEDFVSQTWEDQHCTLPFTRGNLREAR